jgi:hypothetical protein
MASKPSARNSNSEAVRVRVTVSVDLVLYDAGILFPFLIYYGMDYTGFGGNGNHPINS